MRNSYFLGNFKRVLDLFEENFPEANCVDLDIYSLLIRSIFFFNETHTSSLIDKLMGNTEFSKLFRQYKTVFEPIQKGVLKILLARKLRKLEPNMLS